MFDLDPAVMTVTLHLCWGPECQFMVDASYDYPTEFGPVQRAKALAELVVTLCQERALQQAQGALVGM